MKTTQLHSIAKPEHFTMSGSGEPKSLKRLFATISEFLKSISNKGVRPGLTASEIKRVRLTNLASLLGLLLGAIEIPVYLYMGLTVSAGIVFISVLCMSGAIIFSSYGLYGQSRILLLSTVNCILFFSGIYLGKASGVQQYFFTMVLMPFVFFDLKDKVKIIVFISLAIAFTFLLEYIDWSAFEDKSISDSTKKMMAQSALPTAFVTIIFSVYSLVKENSSSERLLAENETLFKGLLDATPDSTIITDSDGYITLCNMQLTNAFGYQAGELIGKHISMLIPPHFREEHAQYYSMLPSEVKRNVKKSHVDLYVAKKDGREVPVELSLNSYLARTGRMIIVVIRDITERKKYEQELIQFSYVVSHDLKAPLRAIFKLSEWIQEELAGNASDFVRKNLEMLRGRVFRLEGLINGLLEYAKIGRTNVKNEKVNTDTLINEVVDMLAPASHIKIKIGEDMPTFETPKVPLQQVFFNLLSNAIKYNDKQDGVIEVNCESNGKFYNFSVSDNGIGIEPIYHEKIFVIFQTLEARDKVEGTGIGLAITKKSVEDMGGKVSLQSEPGKGSVFTFSWPKNN